MFLFVTTIVILSTVVKGGLEDVLAHQDLFSAFDLTKFVADGASGKVYKATYKSKEGDKSGYLQETAVKIVEKREDNERKLENEIKTLKALRKCHGVQRFLVAFEHCGQEHRQLSTSSSSSTSSEERDATSENTDNVAKSAAQVETSSSACYIWVVTRWVEGKQLSGLIGKGQRFDSHQVKDFGEVLMGTLAQVHAKGIVHSDLDSSNIVIEEGGPPTVVDFGEAEWVGSDGRPASDVVGLALTLVEMSMGVRATFDEETVEEKCNYLQDAINNDSIDEDLKKLCRDVCERCATNSERCTAQGFLEHEYFAQ